MEIDGHPTQDMIDELVRRSAVWLEGTTEGPDAASLRFLAERLGEQDGFWLYVPMDAFRTGVDELPR